jgi:hypothetical protein
MGKIILSILISTTAWAGDSAIKVQYGIAFDAERTLDSRRKSINIGVYKHLRNPVSYSINGGYLGDNDVDLNTGYVCGQFGAALNPLKFMFVENYFGPCYFQRTDGKLSGNLQFALNIGAGWRDPDTKSEIGINWKHFSNAGLKQPNVGIDLLMFSIAWGI